MGEVTTEVVVRRWWREGMFFSGWKHEYFFRIHTEHGTIDTKELLDGAKHRFSDSMRELFATMSKVYS